MIPEKIDPIDLLDRINAAGIMDSKIHLYCGLREGYISQVRRGVIKGLRYEVGAKLLNLLESRGTMSQETGTSQQTTV